MTKAKAPEPRFGMVVQNDHPAHRENRFLVLGTKLTGSGEALVDALGLSGSTEGSVTRIGWLDEDGSWVGWIILEPGIEP